MRSGFVIFFLVLSSILSGASTVFAQETVKEGEQLDFAQGLLSRGMYDMAIAQYQKFITDYPHSQALAEAYLSLGEGYFLSQDFDKAVDTYDQFKQLFPASQQLPMSILRLGQIDIRQKKYDQALKELTSIDAQHQLSRAMLQSFDYYTAKAYAGNADDKSAIEYYIKATQVQGASDYTADAFEETGKIQTQEGDYDHAVDAYAKAIALANDDAMKGNLAYQTAEVYFLWGKYADAINGFEQVIEKYPTLGVTQDALANMLLAYFNLGQYDQLLKVYQQYGKQIKYDDAFFAVHYAAVLAYVELKEYDQANTLLDHILAFQGIRPKERAKIFIKKADILIRQKKFKDGLALVEAYAPENTDDADESFFLRAQGYFGLEDYDRAFNFFENVYTNFPNSLYRMASLLGQAHTRKETGRFKEAEGLFLKYYSLQDDPDLKSEALYDGIMMASKAGDQDSLVSYAQEYLKNFPKGGQYGKVLYILADNYGQNNDPKDAVDLLQGFLKNPRQPERSNTAYFLLGYNLQLSGDEEGALAAYQKIDQKNDDGKFYFSAQKNMGIIYLNQKKYDQARECFDRLISQAGQNELKPETYVWVCNEFLKKQQFDDVLRIASQAQKYFGDQINSQIMYYKAEALRGLGRCDEAQKDYAVVTSSSSKDVFTGSAHIGEGLCLEKTDKNDQAEAEFQKALDENPDDFTITIHARYELAGLDETAGKLDDALKLYLLIASIYDDDHFCSESLLKAGEISEKLKHKDDAVKIYSEITDKYKNSPAAGFAQERLDRLK